MSVPLAPSGTNVQRWMLIKLVQFPATDRFGAALPAELVNTQKNVRWNILIDWKPEIKADTGAFAWGEVYRGWSLCLVEAQLATINLILADPRAPVRTLSGKLLTETLTGGERTALNTRLLELGFTQTEITNFSLTGKTVRQIFDWLNRGVFRCTYNGTTITQTDVFVAASRTLDDVIDEFNRIKRGA